MADWSTGYQLAQEGFAQAARNRQARAALAQEAERQGSMLQLGQNRLEQDAAAQTSMDAYRRAMIDQATKNFELDQEAFNFRKTAAEIPPLPKGIPLGAGFAEPLPDGMAGPPAPMSTSSFGGSGMRPKNIEFDPALGRPVVTSWEMIDPAGEAKALTESQAKKQKFVDLMRNNAEVIDAYEKRADPTSLRVWAQELLPETMANFVRTPEYQAFRMAADRWSMANLRDESGAVINEDEARLAFRNYFPQPGDEPATVAQKAAARAAAEAGMAKGLPQLVSASGRPGQSPAIPQEKFNTPEEFVASGMPGGLVFDPDSGRYRPVTRD